MLKCTVVVQTTTQGASANRVGLSTWSFAAMFRRRYKERELFICRETLLHGFLFCLSLTRQTNFLYLHPLKKRTGVCLCFYPNKS